jgi:hypothetical protein
MDKRFLIIGGVSIILILLSAVSVLVFLEIHQAKSEGLAFAKKRDKRACVREVTRGKRICKQVSCFLNNRYFFQTCMDNARPSTSLCNNIPPIGNLFQFEAWKTKQCKKTGRTDRTCHHIWQKVRNSCKAEKN